MYDIRSLRLPARRCVDEPLEYANSMKHIRPYNYEILHFHLSLAKARSLDDNDYPPGMNELQARSSIHVVTETDDDLNVHGAPELTPSGKRP
ncbi:hypothetical protein G7009_25935 [Pseudomonas capeferrum]|uniref:hypothetical protein n=1 Tax=Pseudomonas capeferrum TaxID=1495066 RepID=UPI0015E49624|nr:hypothetical protein [Pseudomonas capeferrum]MBA1205158.1 hypothetical protein [Pseudomonas capeferrum]